MVRNFFLAYRCVLSRLYSHIKERRERGEEEEDE
jgi:hypothetical protein